MTDNKDKKEDPPPPPPPPEPVKWPENDQIHENDVSKSDVWIKRGNKEKEK